MAYHHRLQPRERRRKLCSADFAALGLGIVMIDGKAAARTVANFDIYEADDWFAERLEEVQIIELVRIGERLNANVVGDEGEICTIENGALVEKAQPQRSHSLWWRRNRWIFIYGSVLVVIYTIALLRRWPLFE